MDSFMSYHELTNLLGLSRHKHQLERRKAKYPNHFSEVENKVFVSKEYANFLMTCRWTQQASQILQKGGNND